MVNLHEMKVISHTCYADASFSKPSTINIKFHRNTSELRKYKQSGEYDDCLTVALSEKDSELIHIFTIKIPYNQQHRQKIFKSMTEEELRKQELPPITSFLNGYVV